MFLNKTADKLVFKFLKKIDYGYIEITTFDGKLLKFGNPEEILKANIVIKDPSFNYNLIRGGSIAFAESYMRGEFETNNLSNKLSSIVIAWIAAVPLSDKFSLICLK